MTAGAVEPVFNMQVAKCHTYFVATDDRASCMLVHNDYGPEEYIKHYELGHHYAHGTPKMIGNKKYFVYDKKYGGKRIPIVEVDILLPNGPEKVEELDFRAGLIDAGVEPKSVRIALSGDRQTDYKAAIQAFKGKYGENFEIDGPINHDVTGLEVIEVNGDAVVMGTMTVVPKGLHGTNHSGGFVLAEMFYKS